jgi:hypothetical protein
MQGHRTTSTSGISPGPDHAKYKYARFPVGGINQLTVLAVESDQIHAMAAHPVP